MNSVKLKDFDKQNPNYDYLITAIQEGNIKLNEDENIAFVNSSILKLKFFLGMKAYLNNQGYEVIANNE